MRDQLNWYDDKAEESACLDALTELRQRGARGYCYQHVQAITVAIDQYAEQPRLLLNKP